MLINYPNFAGEKYVSFVNKVSSIENIKNRYLREFSYGSKRSWLVD